MKKTLLSASSNGFLWSKSFASLLVLLAVLLGTTNETSAQCVTPYQKFHSVDLDANMTAQGWTRNIFTVGVATANARSGNRYYFQTTASPATTPYFTTETIANPSSFNFWIKRGAATALGYKVEMFYSGAYYDLSNAGDLATLGIAGADVSIPALALNNTYYNFTLNNIPNTLTNVHFRISDTRPLAPSSTAGSLFVDDFAWTSHTASLNTTIVPLISSAATCTVSVPITGSYYLYDNGGEYDVYWFNQNNNIVFTPAVAGYKIKLTFETFRTENGTSPNIDYLQLFDDATFTSQIGSNLAGIPGVMPGPYTATNAGGSIATRFVSNTNGVNNNDFGYRIKVECVNCPIPTTLAGSAVANGANLTWNGGTGTNFDIYQATNSTPVPTSGTTPTYTSTAANYSATGLTPGTTYYYWVRNNCGSEQSTWVGPVAVTPICSPVGVPYIEDFNGLATGALPACTTSTKATPPTNDWGANNVNGNIFSNIEGSNFYTKGVSLVAGTNYRITYDYSNVDITINPATYLDVYIGSTNTTPSPSNITTNIGSFITTTSVVTEIFNFTAPSTGTYYLRFDFSAQSDPSVAQNLDNIRIEVETCLRPTFVGGANTTASPYVTAITDFGATITWNTPSTGQPSNGYQYYISTTPIAPNFNATATGTVPANTNSVVLSTLSPNTTYYVWVRGDCGGQMSNWTQYYAYFTTTNLTTPTTVKISDVETNPASGGALAYGTGCNITFTDSNANTTNLQYVDFEDHTYTFRPATAGTKLKVVFSTFATENNWDGLMIYSGDDSPGNTRQLMSSGRAAGFNATTCPAGAYSGTQSPGTIISTAANGSLSFTFKSDFIITAAGWTANISCVTVPIITSFSPNNNSCGTAGVVVTINGSNFTGATSVSFGGISTTAFTVNGAGTQITVTVPANAVTGKIRVNNATAFGDSLTNFTVQQAGPVTTGVTACVGTPSGAATTLTALGSCAGAAVNTFSGSLTTSSPTATRPLTGTSCTLSGIGNNAYYQATSFTVPVSGIYSFETANGGIDFFAYIVSGAFVPGNCGSGTFIAADDDAGAGLQPLLSVNLTAGVVYTLYTTTWTNGVTGSYTWNVTPPTGSGGVELGGQGIVEWYTAATGGTAIGTGSNFNPIGVASSGLTDTNTPGTTTYYAACSANSGCRTATTFVITTVSGGTATANQTLCASDPLANLTVSGFAGSVTKWQYNNTDSTFATGTTVDIASSASATLTAAQMGAFTGTRYFRAVVTAGSCTGYSNTVTIVINAGPTAGTASTSQTICSGSFADLTLSGSAGTVTKWQYNDTDATFATGTTVDIPSSASTTLTTAQIGTISGTRYFRAVVTSGSCSSYSNTVTLTYTKTIWNGSAWSNGVPTTTKGAEFQGDYSSTGNLIACSVVVTSGNVVFNIGHTLRVQSNVVVNGGSLTFEDKSSLYQVNAFVNGPGAYNGGNIGNITYKRTATPMFKFDYTYWSTPVNPQILGSVSPTSPTNLYYDFNGTAWTYINSPTTYNMIPGKGYIFRAPTSYPVGAPSAPQYLTGVFTGVPNSGVINIPIVGGSGQLNLLGNPYPSTILADDFINLNPNLNGSLYFWTHNTPITNNQYSAGDYAVYNILGGSAAATNLGAGNNTVPNGYITSAQGFFVEGLAGGSALFNNSMRRSGNNSQFFRTTESQEETNESPYNFEKHRYWVDITNGQAAFKQVLIGYVETATNGMDRLFDAKMVDNNALSLYTKVENNKLTIQGKPLPFDVNEQIPLAYKTAAAGTYTIVLSNFDGLFTDQNIYLEDTLLNVIHNLKQGNYTFATEAGTFENRFVLRYTDTNALGTDNPVFNEDTVIVYKNNSGLFIEAGNTNLQTVSIFDIRGRLLATQSQIQATSASFTNLPETQQVLLVKVVSENGETVTKKVVY